MKIKRYTNSQLKAITDTLLIEALTRFDCWSISAIAILRKWRSWAAVE